MCFPLLKDKPTRDAIEHFDYKWPEEPYVGDRVKVHFRQSDPWIENYRANKIVDGDTGTIGRALGPPSAQMFIVHFDKPLTKLTGIAFKLCDLEYVGTNV